MLARTLGAQPTLATIYFSIMNYASLGLSTILATLLVAFAPPVNAQCTKDTDCKGDRICERGVCMSPRIGQTEASRPSPPATLPQAPAANDVAQRVSRALQDQLSCAANPEPAKVLRALRANGFIGMQPKTSVDGMHIFAVLKPLVVWERRVVEVTGWEDVNDRTLFWRGPGTPPPVHIQAVVEGNVGELALVVSLNGGSKAKFEKPYFSEYKSQVAAIVCYAN
jgi:hypothetical protein